MLSNIRLLFKWIWAFVMQKYSLLEQVYEGSLPYSDPPLAILYIFAGEDGVDSIKFLHRKREKKAV